MGNECEILKNHCDIRIAIMPQLFVRERQYVFTVDNDPALCWFQKAIDVSDERRLTAARKPHNAENFAAVNL